MSNHKDYNFSTAMRKKVWMGLEKNEAVEIGGIVQMS